MGRVLQVLNRLSKARRIARALLWVRRNRTLAPPRLLDIGARGGLQSKWEVLRRLCVIEPVLAEPDTEERERLRAQYPDLKILPYALSNKQEIRELLITRSPGLTSTLKPLLSVVELVADPTHYDIIKRKSVQCTSLSSLRDSKELDRCHFLKVDTQGLEYEIITGLGRYIDEIVGLEIESRFIPVYEGEKTVSAMTEMLFLHGFELRALRPLGLSGRGIIEANLVFTRAGTLSPTDEAYRDLYERVQGLSRDSFAFSVRSE